MGCQPVCEVYLAHLQMYTCVVTTLEIVGHIPHGAKLLKPFRLHRETHDTQHITKAFQSRKKMQSEGA